MQEQAAFLTVNKKLVVKRIIIKAIIIFSAYTHPECFIKANGVQCWALMDNHKGLDNFLTQSSADDFNTFFLNLTCTGCGYGEIAQ